MDDGNDNDKKAVLWGHNKHLKLKGNLLIIYCS